MQTPLQTYWIRIFGHGVWASASPSSTQRLHRVSVKQGIFREGWLHRDDMTATGRHELTNSTEDLNGRGASLVRELEGACP